MESPAGTNTDQRRITLKRCTLPIVFVCAMTAAIILGVDLLLQRSVDQVIRAEAENEAQDWAERVSGEFGDPTTLFAQGMLTESQQYFIDAVLTYSNAFSFVLFDSTGRLVYSSDYGISEATAEQAGNPVASSVARSGRSQIDIIQRSTPGSSPSVFANVYVPLLASDERVTGVIGLYLDKSRNAALITGMMHFVGILLPIICALVYALPALAFVMKREQAFARTQHVTALARYDQLTGTLNRHTFSRECIKCFANRQPDEKIGVFFLDVDRFKAINDEHGHGFGDAYLTHLASILLRNVRPGDLVGRMGGDEFVMALPDASRADMERIGRAILEDAKEPFSHKGRTIRGSVSQGYHLADMSMGTPEALHAADLALYHAKESGRNTLVEYFPGLDAAKVKRRRIEARLREALEQDAFDAVFQPITSTSDGKIAGFEALLRLNHADGTAIPPDDFIPVAEDCGLIHEIGAYSLRRAIETAKDWPDAIFVSVNMSPVQFERGHLVETITTLLAEQDFPPHRLELEITEGLLLGDREHVSEQLIQLKALGVHIAMDDFGTGYSSLGYLWKYDFDKLKIDKIFMEGLDFDAEKYREVIETIVILGQKMGMTVVVEGIETPHQVEVLREMGCDQYQGFLIGRPMPAEATLLALAAAPTWPGTATASG